jgi:hypothetical protein
VCTAMRSLAPPARAGVVQCRSETSRPLRGRIPRDLCEVGDLATFARRKSRFSSSDETAVLFPEPPGLRPPQVSRSRSLR